MNKNKNKIYLAYGSNLNLEQMANRCPTAKVIGTSKLKDYQLLFRSNTRSNCVATVEPLKGSSVPVLLWEIKARDEAALDRYEGYPWLYRKETVTVDLEGKEVEAMVYIMNEGKLGVPNRYYYNVILEGYQACGFDVSILGKGVYDSIKGLKHSV